MAPITEFMTLKRVYGPQSVKKFNVFNYTTLTRAVNPGYSSGYAITAIEDVAEPLPRNYINAYSGLQH